VLGRRCFSTFINTGEIEMSYTIYCAWLSSAEEVIRRIGILDGRIYSVGHNISRNHGRVATYRAGRPGPGTISNSCKTPTGQ
jgi:hypothetical protein